jgi:hypothetical protein
LILGGKKFFSPVWWVCGGCVVGSLEENKNELAH